MPSFKNPIFTNVFMLVKCRLNELAAYQNMKLMQINFAMLMLIKMWNVGSVKSEIMKLKDQM